MNKQRINNIGDKVNALTYLYKDWLHYKKYYKSIGFPMKETFIEYIKREIDIESIGGNKNITMKLTKVNKTISDYVCVFPDRHIKLQSGKIKVYSTTETDTFDNKKQMKEWLQKYIKKQKINLPRLKRLQQADTKRLQKDTMVWASKVYLK